MDGIEIRETGEFMMITGSPSAVMPTYPSSRVVYSDNGADPESWGGGGKGKGRRNEK
ncbi:hypothetical protein CY34DRAFT_804902 [Suillus luteus UH-Slu-Lm8-n1]|uniref:Uncharacterized protein n=1 Tax=Suillus luteus UH-Slu-Lm8-n1 TaxID=930992 RepID=A0A0D0AXE8_9AGAM|nr:hypothetical protein CY34DRAFT_804902 [Suillus luteus UH-Slu-Lm8-n1]